MMKSVVKKKKERILNIYNLLRLIPVKRLLTLAWCVPLFIIAHSQSLDKTRPDLFFDQLAQKNKAMGTVVIAKNGNILYTRAIGYSQITVADKKPATLATRYRVGSITKMFTAAMIFQLVEEGKLNLASTLDAFFPRIPNAQKITIAQILAHRSGIHSVTEDRNMHPSRTNPITRDEMIALIAKGNPDFEPGTKYAYSNSGYFILGCIVEKLTGKNYEDALTERITSRIGLNDTYVGGEFIDTHKNESFSYRYLQDWQQEPETHISILLGSGSLVSTSTDLAAFIKALFDGKLVTQENLSLMMQNNYGMDTFRFAGKTFYGHTGGIDGFGAWLAYLPEEKLAIAYTSNGKVYPVANIITGLADIYFNNPFQIPAFETVAVSTNILDKYTGVYSRPDAPVKFTITRDNSTLYVQPTGQSIVPLEAITQDRFRIESAGIIFEFDAAKNQMTIKRNGGERLFTKEQ